MRDLHFNNYFIIQKKKYSFRCPVKKSFHLISDLSSEMGNQTLTNEFNIGIFLESFQMFAGNTNNETTTRRDFSHPIIARKLRLYPRGHEFTIYCLRMEIYGCKWTHRKRKTITTPWGIFSPFCFLEIWN